jgi:hypothetical protein
MRINLENLTEGIRKNNYAALGHITLYLNLNGCDHLTGKSCQNEVNREESKIRKKQKARA